MPRILPTLSPRDIYRLRHNITPLWWRDLARWCILPTAALIIASYAVWEPLGRAGALLMVWTGICAILGTEPRRDDDRDRATRITPPRGTLGRPAPRPPARSIARGPRTTAPRRGAGSRRSRPRTPVG